MTRKVCINKITASISRIMVLKMPDSLCMCGGSGHETRHSAGGVGWSIHTWYISFAMLICE